MRLSIFRQKSNNTRPASSTNGSPSPSSPKKSGSRRLSQMLSPTRFKFDTSSDSKPTSPAATHNSFSSDRPTTASPPLNPLNSPENTPPSTQSLNHFSSDGPRLPTSEPSDSFYGSSNFDPQPTSGLANSRFVAAAAAAAQTSPTASRGNQLEQRRASAVASTSNSDGPLSPNTNSIPQHSSPPQSPSRYSNSRQRIAPDALSSSTYVRSNTSHDPLSPDLDTFLADRFQTPTTKFRADRKFSYPAEDQVSYGNSSFAHSSTQSVRSSPTDAAAQRKLRVSSYNVNSSVRSGSTLRSSGSDNALGNRMQSFDMEPSRVSSKHLLSQNGSKINGQLDGPDERPSKRPVYLQSHQSSQRSSTQSRESDITIGADDANTTGGLTPGGDLRRLSRLSSFGSLASTASEGTEIANSQGHRRSRSSTMQHANRGTLECVAESKEDGPVSQQVTPRAQLTHAADPTDTVLAQHVRDIEVPATIAREYKASQRPSNESRFLGSSPFRSLNKNNLSLKEQNAKIDKLTKENFDLKLKIHFLYQALGERSDEGVRDTIAKNAQLQADLVSVKKENQTLRKRIRLLEKQQINDGGSVAPSHLESEDGSRSIATQQLEEEMGHMQQRMQDLEHENAQLAGEGQYMELCTRLDEEIVRREDAERHIRSMQLELQRMKSEQSPSSRLKLRPSNGDLTNGRSRSRISQQEANDNDSLSGNTLVEHLRKENEMLKRDLGAQASMLTSRNREKDRLQQEIEAIKLIQRRGEGMSPDSNAGDSILDRSVSRAQNRSASRASGSTRESQLSDPERDHYETTQAALRDENSMLKMQVQDLERELDSLGDGAEHIRGLQEDREDAVQALREADEDMEYLTNQIREMDRALAGKENDVADLKDALRRRERESESFRAELHAINHSFNSVVDDSEAAQATIQSLRQDLSAANGELEAMEINLRDITAAKERLEVQQESSQSEINFLRDEQEGDKIKIGDLQSALRNATANLGNGPERLREFEDLEHSNSKARDDIRKLRLELAEKLSEIKNLKDHLADATATLEEAMVNFDNTKNSYNDEIAQLQQDFDRLMDQLEQARDLHDHKDQVIRSREASLESSGHETRRLAELLEKERQGRKHEKNEFDRALHRARGTPEAKVIELENALKSGEDKIADLERTLDSNQQQRDELLHSVWNRLASICNTESITEQQPFLESASEVSKGLPGMAQQLPNTLEAIAAHIQSFRAKIDNTERETLEDFQALSEALSERTTRLAHLEKSLSRTTSAKYIDKIASLKDENKLLRRELRFMKQGSFALPGLPTPGDGLPLFDSRSSVPASRGGGRSENGIGGVDVTPSPLVPHGPRSSDKSKNRHSVAHGNSILLRTHSEGDARSLSATHLPSLPGTREAGDEDVDEVTQEDDFRDRRTGHLRAGIEPRFGLEAPRLPMRSASSGAGGGLVVGAAERTWMWKLEEVMKRLKMEREDRLLDRKAARERIVQGEKERDDLKTALRREKEKARSAGLRAADAETTPEGMVGNTEGATGSID